MAVAINRLLRSGGFLNFLRLNPAFFMFLLAALTCGLKDPSVRPGVAVDEGLTVEVDGFVSSFPEQGTEYAYFEVRPQQVRQVGRIYPFPGRIGVYVYGQEHRILPGVLPEMGDRISFTAFLSEPSYYRTPGVDDFRALLWHRGILRIVRLKSGLQIQRLEEGGALRPLKPLLRHVSRFQKFLTEHLKPEACRLVLTAFLGRKKSFETEERERIRQLGIFHLFVVSGFHVSLVVGFLHLFLRRAGVAGLLVTLGTSWLYVFLSGAGLPAIRAGVMTSVFYLLWSLGFRPQLLNGLGLAGLLILFIWPNSVFDPGFQFSFVSLTAIGIFVIPWTQPAQVLVAGVRDCWSEHVSTSRHPAARQERRVRFALEDIGEPFHRHMGVRHFLRLGAQATAYFMQLVVGGLLIQLFAFALTLHYSNRLVWTQWLSNLMLMPLFGLFLPSCLILFLLHGLPGGQMALYCTGWLAGLVEFVISSFVPISQTTFLPQPGIVKVLAYQAALVTILLLPGRHRIVSLLVPPSVLAALLAVGGSEMSDKLTLTMLDVGQGESIHVEYPDGRNALVDTGGSGSWTGDFSSDFVGERVVGRYLWSERRARLDFVLLTHPHSDHIQGLGFLRRAFAIDRLLFFEFHSLYEGLPLSPTEASSVFSVGEVAHLVLHPNRDEQNAAWTTNDASVVVWLSYRDFSILLSGDVEKAAERLLVSRLPQVTLLKVPHHGGKASCSSALLEATDPSLAIISAGRNNLFGHPSADVTARLEERGIPFLITAQNGSIRIETDGRTWKAGCFDGKTGSFETVLSGVAHEGAEPDHPPRITR